MAYLSDIEIAQGCVMQPITEIAKLAHVDEKYLEIKYPMSWEIKASEAKYEKIAPLSEEYAKNKCGAPHSWHASEMFMYLIEWRK